MENENLSDEQLAEILQSITEGRQIEAIKAYRAATGADLRMAKEAVDSLSLGLSLDGVASTGNQKLNDEQLNTISESILAGKKIEAIKAYRELTGLGLKDSNEEIEKIRLSLAKDHPELLKNKSKGCASVIVIGFLLGFAVLECVDRLPLG